MHVPGQSGLLLVFFWAIGTVLAVLHAAAPKDDKAKTFAAALASLKLRDIQGIDVIVTWLERLGVPLRDRNDLAQEVLIRAFSSWHTYDPSRFRPSSKRGTKKRRARAPGRRSPRPAFHRWMNTIAKNVAANYFQAAQHRLEDLVPDPLPEDTPDENTPAPDARVEYFETRAELAAALRSLLPLSRRVLLGSIQLQAARTGQSASTLYNVRNRARAELATMLEGNPISLRRGQLAALATARRVLRAQGLEEREIRALLRAASAGRYSVTVFFLIRRGRALGLPVWVAGPLSLAAIAVREAAGAEGERAGELRRLAVDAAEVALGRLGRAYGTTRYS